MTVLFDHPVLLFLATFIFLALLAQLGFRIRQTYPASKQDALHEQMKEGRDGIVFLLSLLLGFTLAMALTRYDLRKQLLVDEADAIGTTGLRAHLLPDPQGRQITRFLADYADARVAYFKAGNDRKSTEATLVRANRILTQIWQLTQEAARAAPTPITSIFIQSLNETIDISEKQIATLENRVPFSVWLMILVIAVLACLVSGLAVRQRMLISMLLTPLTAAVVISLTADLDTPRTGLIRVGIGSIERVQADLHSSSSPSQLAR